MQKRKKIKKESEKAFAVSIQIKVSWIENEMKSAL